MSRLQEEGKIIQFGRIISTDNLEAMQDAIH